MSYEVLRAVFIFGAVLSGVCFAIAVVLFFILRIPSVIGDLTGATAKKGIENIRSKNGDAGQRIYKTSQVNRGRGKITSKITPSGRLMEQTSGLSNGAMATSKIGTNRLIAMAREGAAASSKSALPAEETTLLSAQPGTTRLEPAQNINETTVLTQTETGDFTVEYEINFLSTDEPIA